MSPPGGPAGADRAGRLLELDGIRGVAILLVLVWHYFTCQIVAEPKSLPGFLARASSLTWSGVDLFFVLSGFLIAGILLDHRGAANFFKVFYLRRVCRIFPLYFLVLLLFIYAPLVVDVHSAPFRWLFADSMPTWSYATFTQNILMGRHESFGANWLGITWSLAIEEQFYLVIPLLIYFLPRKMAFWLFAAAVVAAPLLRHLSPGFHAFVLAPWRADSLLMGACLAFLFRSPRFMASMQKYRRVLLAVLLWLLLGAALVTFHSQGLDAFRLQFWLALLFSTLLLVALVNRDGRLGSILRSRILVWLGTLSFGIYMLHQAVSGLVHGLLRGDAPAIASWSDAGVTALALTLTLALAALSYRFLESPLLAAGHRLRFVDGQRLPVETGKDLDVLHRAAAER